MTTGGVSEPLTGSLDLVDIASNVLEAAVACLNDTTLGIPEQQFIYHGSPIDDCCDHVAVWLRGLVPTTTDRFPAAIGGEARCGDLVAGAAMSVTLMRPCWPQPKDKRFPAPDIVTEAAAALLEDARVLWCCLIAAHADRLIVPDGYAIVWGQMTPRRGGGCAGWQWDFTVETPSCCWPPPDLDYGS